MRKELDLLFPKRKSIKQYRGEFKKILTEKEVIPGQILVKKIKSIIRNWRKK